MKLVLIWVIGLVLINLSALAEESKAKENKRKGPPDGLSVGGGAILNSFPYLGMQDQFRIIPAISYKKGRFWLRGPTLSYTVLSLEKTQVAILLSPNLFGAGYKSEDSPALAGMERRKGSLNLGVSFRQKIKRVNISGNVYRDVIGRHNGLRSELLIGSSFPISKLFKKIPFTLISLNVGGAFYDRRFSTYFYGVRPSESTSTRPEYTVSTSVNTKITTSLMTNFSKRVTARIGVDYEKLNSKIRNSPIVGKRSLTSGRFFTTYRF